MVELESWSAWSAFAALQKSARNHAGMDSARSLIRDAGNIRRLRYRQMAEEVEREAREGDELRADLQQAA
jgi:hypothetical protein